MSNSAPISPNARRWLNLISYAEGTYGNRGPRYDVTFGYTPIKDLSRHPNRVVNAGGYSSAAAGAYQFMPATYAGASKALGGLPDFRERSQDLAALYLVRQRGVDPDRSPVTPETIARLSPEWASFPTLQGSSYHGQPSKPINDLLRFAKSQGATTAPSVPNLPPPRGGGRPFAVGDYISPEYTRPGAARTSQGAQAGSPPAPAGSNSDFEDRIAAGIAANLVTNYLTTKPDQSLYDAPKQTVPLSSDDEDSDEGNSEISEIKDMLRTAQEQAAMNSALRRRDQEISTIDNESAASQAKIKQLMKSAQEAFTSNAPQAV